jgi:hypothetical protein
VLSAITEPHRQLLDKNTVFDSALLLSLLFLGQASPASSGCCCISQHITILLPAGQSAWMEQLQLKTSYTEVSTSAMQRRSGDEFVLGLLGFLTLGGKCIEVINTF